MIVYPEKPLVQDDDRTSTLGDVMDGIIKIDRARKESAGDFESFPENVKDKQSKLEKNIDVFVTEVDAALLAHTSKKGAVHGETKATVDLDQKKNWRMATMQEHLTGANSVYAHPKGNQALIEDRLKVEPSAHLKTEIVPVAVYGQLGYTNQWPYAWDQGIEVQSVIPSTVYHGDTPFLFATDTGFYLQPGINGSPVMVPKALDPVYNRYIAITHWGGYKLNVFGNTLEVKAATPTLIRGWGVPSGQEQVRVSQHLFDRHSVSFREGDLVGIRSYNKNRIPADVIWNNTTFKERWTAITEVRENVLLNISSYLTYENLGGLGNDIYLVIETAAATLKDLGNSAVQEAKSTEYLKQTDVEFTTYTYTVPSNNKVRILTRAGKYNAICIKLGDILSYTAAQAATLWANLNKGMSTLIAFEWTNRLKGSFELRIPIGFTTVDGKFYNNYYIDLGMTAKENVNTKTMSIQVESLKDMVSGGQTLNNNLTLSGAGKFIQYNASVAGNVFHPKLFRGVFEPQGGHIAPYTVYGRRYIGYYKHALTSVSDFIHNALPSAPTSSVYRGTSSLQNDGFYGDHLRHIPLFTTTPKSTYLCQVRDWRNNYRWSVVTVDRDTQAYPKTNFNKHIGPWRDSVQWIQPKEGFVPSFLMVNDESVNGIATNCLVFNTQNNYTGYARYALDVNNADEPLTWIDKVTVDKSVIDWITANAGNWVNKNIQLFYFENIIYWFCQLTKSNELKADGIDCYYGIIDDALISVNGNIRVLKTNNPVVAYGTSTPLKVNTKENLDLDKTTVTGFDQFDSTDVYMFKLPNNGTIRRYKVMVNLGPFNNFYFDFELEKNVPVVGTRITPNLDGGDKLFPYDLDNDFQFSYDELIGYGTRFPVRLHANFQSPVMLNTCMWYSTKVPDQYQVWSSAGGDRLLDSSIMSGIEGVTVFPLGSVFTHKGKTELIKDPVSIKSNTFNNSEIFVGVYNGKPVLFNEHNNPYGLSVEPESGSVPVGFFIDGAYQRWDSNSWKNSMYPVLDNKRLSHYAYGSTVPVLLGVPGANNPINRYFRYKDYVPNKRDVKFLSFDMSVNADCLVTINFLTGKVTMYIEDDFRANSGTVTAYPSQETWQPGLRGWANNNWQHYFDANHTWEEISIPNAMLAKTMRVRVGEVITRQAIIVTDQPTAANGYVAVIHCYDVPPKGAGYNYANVYITATGDETEFPLDNVFIALVQVAKISNGNNPIDENWTFRVTNNTNKPITGLEVDFSILVPDREDETDKPADLTFSTERLVNSTSTVFNIEEKKTVLINIPANNSVLTTVSMRGNRRYVDGLERYTEYDDQVYMSTTMRLDGDVKASNTDRRPIKFTSPLNNIEVTLTNNSYDNQDAKWMFNVTNGNPSSYTGNIQFTYEPDTERMTFSPSGPGQIEGGDRYNIVRTNTTTISLPPNSNTNANATVLGNGVWKSGVVEKDLYDFTMNMDVVVKIADESKRFTGFTSLPIYTNLSILPVAYFDGWGRADGKNIPGGPVWGESGGYPIFEHFDERNIVGLQFEIGVDWQRLGEADIRIPGGYYRYGRGQGGRIVTPLMTCDIGQDYDLAPGLGAIGDRGDLIFIGSIKIIKIVYGNTIQTKPISQVVSEITTIKNDALAGFEEVREDDWNGFQTWTSIYPALKQWLVKLAARSNDPLIVQYVDGFTHWTNGEQTINNLFALFSTYSEDPSKLKETYILARLLRLVSIRSLIYDYYDRNPTSND